MRIGGSAMIQEVLMSNPDELARVQRLLANAREALEDAAFDARRRGAGRPLRTAIEEAIRATVCAEATLE